MSHKMFSRREGAVIGSFHHGHAIIEWNQSEETIEVLRNPELISRYLDEEAALFQLLLECSAVMHERLHYLHTFGTVGGMSMFSARMVALRRFISCAIELRKEGVVWQLPLSKWVASRKAPDAVRKLLRFARAFQTGTDHFLAPFSQFGAEGHTADAWVDVPFPATAEDGSPTLSRVPAFPMSVGIRSSESDDMRPVTILLPMGYEAIVEGIAHGASRSLIGSLFPDLPPDVLQHYGPPKMFDKGQAEKDLDAVARQYEIYTASDLLISKHLRSKKILQFPRNLVFRLSDLALSTSFFNVTDIDDKNTKVEIHNPGYALIHHLTEGDAADLAKNKLEYPAFVQQGYQSMLDGLTSQGDWDTVQPQDTLYTAHRVWESFVAQHISVPLLKTRLESNSETFNTEFELIQFALSMDLPRVEVYNGHLQFHGMPDKVRNAWGQQVFTSELAHQIFADGEILRCPRAHELLPGIDRADFSNGHCRRYKKLGCGTFVPGQPGYTPDCLFTETLKHLSFIPIQPAAQA